MGIFLGVVTHTRPSKISRTMFYRSEDVWQERPTYTVYIYCFSSRSGKKQEKRPNPARAGTRKIPETAKNNPTSGSTNAVAVVAQARGARGKRRARKKTKEYRKPSRTEEGTKDGGHFFTLAEYLGHLVCGAFVLQQK